MGWYKRRDNRETGIAEGEARLSARAKKIADRVLAFQLALAAKLNARAQRLGEFRTRLVLGAVLVAFACYCGYLVLGALF